MGDEVATKDVELTLETAIQLQNDLIKLYMAEDFQRLIWTAMKKADKDDMKIMTAKAECCQTVQLQVIPKYGFAADRKGIQASLKAFTAEMNAHPKVIEKNALMQYLIDPNAQQEAADKNVLPPVGYPLSRHRSPHPDEWPEDSNSGKVWRVVGGADKGGIVVRKDVEVKSAEFPNRLAHHALVEQMELVGDRLKYQKLDGSGPEIGWVSIQFKGKPIVEPYYFDLDPSEVAIPESWKVVNDRVAKRAEPNKDAKMVGGGKKGDVVKGFPMDKDGVQWLKLKEDDPTNKGAKMDCYMMIDGTSVGLGKLLEKM